ncbi:hypothetical protein [Paenibacillus thermotolerans]|uniref:hypothetical protein n=1 Tax=Paenibacillus thermotolerans TaxID=3027807 RepID=UPI002367BCE6|nr:MULTISPECIES: hypothetical protein [unclassified Paenibacillus]
MQQQLKLMFGGSGFYQYERYADQPYARQLTKQFLNHFIQIAQHNYSDVFEILTYHQNLFVLGKNELNTRVSLEIPFTYAYEAKRSRIVFFEYGRLDTVHQWPPVFNTLSTFRLEAPLPQYREVVYWDLLKGDTRWVPMNHLAFAPREKVVAVAQKYIQLKGKMYLASPN